MNSNDTLLCHLIATDEMSREDAPQLKTDHLELNPATIEVAANEIVYIHRILCKLPNFRITVTTPTTKLQLNTKNTMEGSCNTIIKGLGNVHFTFRPDVEFYVQYVRVKY